MTATERPSREWRRTYVAFRLPLYQRIVDLAERDRRTFTAELEVLLERALEMDKVAA